MTPLLAAVSAIAALVAALVAMIGYQRQWLRVGKV
jgi:hypothetical protein